VRLLAAVALAALCTAAAATAGPLPSAQEPNADTVALPQSLAAPTTPSQPMSFDQLLPIWQGAGQAYGVPWSVLAAINKVESGFGANMGPSSAGAIGWMQFMPDTWTRWGVDADGDGVADPWNATDAIYSAARYLAATGAATDIRGAVFSYNHADWYVNEVLQLAAQYDTGGTQFATTLEATQQQLDAAKQAVLDAQATLDEARAGLAAAEEKEAEFLNKADVSDNLTDQLDAEKAAALADTGVQTAQGAVDAAQASLQDAQSALAAAQGEATQVSFGTGAAPLLGSPTYEDGYVFPVAGGAGIVTVGHTHHDYPAADIAAPAGTQEYALHDGTVVDAWPAPTGNCGIGFTISTTDGLRWTYCHLASLEPAVVAGAQLHAGDPVGLVGQTGHADGPHLHLQLDPTTGYPQEEPWFQAFAGTAFTWSDSIQSNAATAPVFAVLGGDGRALESAAPAPVVYFSTSGG
jgi:murein DD-endopeptidase MepM/ murein hydrolase activator NlpD